MEKNLRDFEEELTCGICRDIYTDPRILPCLHYYCKKCIVRLALVEGFGHPFSCPQCRKDVVVADDSEESIQSVFFINRLKDLLASQKKMFDNEKKCSNCLSKNVGMCLSSDCQLLCSSCAERVPQEADGSLEHLNLNSERDAVKCELHDEQLKIYCFDCKMLVCCECTVKGHRSHTFQFVKEAASCIKKELNGNLLPLQKAKTLLSGAVEVIQSVQEDVLVQGAAVVDKIEASFADLHAILDKRKNKLVEEAQQVTNKKAANINTQLKNAILMKATVQSVVDFTEQIVEHFSDRDVLVAHEDICNQIEQALHDCGDKNSLEPVVQADQDFENSVGEFLPSLCEDKARVYQSPLIISAGNLAPEVELNKSASFDLSVSLANEIQYHYNPPVNVELRSLHTDKISPTTITSLGSGKYHVCFKPCTRGRNFINIYINGSETPNQSYPVFVTLPPKQLRRPVRLCQATRPSGIVVNSAGEVIVTEFTTAVVVFDKRGQKLRQLNGSQYRIKHFQAIAVDEDDNLYLPDADSNLMLKVSSDFSDVRVFSIKQVRGPGHFDVAVVQGKVLMTEFGNEGSISMYTRDMKPLRVIYGVDNRIMRCLASDCLDNIYVTHASGVLVFNIRGELMGLIGDGSDGQEKVRDPWSVAVFRQHVFVGDRETDKIMVYDVHRRFVSSIAGYGCIGADQDGFLHVSKFSQNMVYVT